MLIMPRYYKGELPVGNRLPKNKPVSPPTPKIKHHPRMLYFAHLLQENPPTKIPKPQESYPSQFGARAKNIASNTLSLGLLFAIFAVPGVIASRFLINSRLSLMDEKLDLQAKLLEQKAKRARLKAELDFERRINALEIATAKPRQSTIITDFTWGKVAFLPKQLAEREKLHTAILKDVKSGNIPFDHLSKVAAYTLPALTQVTSDISNTTYSAGTGFVYSKSGIIITNNHVITEEGNTNKNIEVTLYDGTRAKATVIAQDQKHDLAALKIDPNGLDLPTLPLAFEQGSPGDPVLLAGNLGNYTFSTVPTSIAAIERSIEGRESWYLQLARTFPGGTSGSPVVNKEGKVIGLFTLGVSDSNIGLCVPSIPRMVLFAKNNKLDKQ